MSLRIEVTDSDRSEAAAFLKEHKNAVSLKRRVDDAYEAARRHAGNDPLGWSRGARFTEFVLYPAHRTWEHGFRQLAVHLVEQVAWCFASERFFSECARSPFESMQPAGLTAA